MICRHIYSKVLSLVTLFSKGNWALTFHKKKLAVWNGAAGEPRGAQHLLQQPHVSFFSFLAVFVIPFNSLEELILSYNNLTSVPSPFFGVFFLKIFCSSVTTASRRNLILLSDKKNRFLRPEMGGCGRLRKLDVRGNDISQVPETLFLDTVRKKKLMTK